MRAWQLALLGWLGLLGAMAADQWGLLGRTVAMAADPVLLLGALAIGAALRPWWLAALALLALVVAIEWQVGKLWGRTWFYLEARLYAGLVLASTAAALREAWMARRRG
jgi:hypothetical protein